MARESMQVLIVKTIKFFTLGLKVQDLSS